MKVSLFMASFLLAGAICDYRPAGLRFPARLCWYPNSWTTCDSTWPRESDWWSFFGTHRSEDTPLRRSLPPAQGDERIEYHPVQTSFTRNDQRRVLQVRLELDVVTHLAVDLKAVALTVGDDDPISLWIEVHRRRETEAPERLEIARPPVRLHHVGVGVDALLSPLRHHLGIAH